jgi:hypothetical protein
MREETKKRDLHFPCLYHITLFLLSYHLLSSLLVSVCVLGYGWKRLDFDIFLEDRQSGLPPLQRFLHCSAEGSEP